MGEILNILYDLRNRIMQKKTYLQTANTEIVALDKELAKLNTIISQIEVGGWDT